MGGRGSGSASAKAFALGTKEGNAKFLEIANQRAGALQGASNPNELINARKNAEFFVGNVDARIGRLEPEMAQLEKAMERYSHDASGHPNKVPGTTKEGHQRYREASRRHQRLRSARDTLIDAKTLVNQALAKK